MKRRIDALISKHKFTTYNDFIKAIKQDRNLFESFVNYLTINVSEFYRNPEQWKMLENEILPSLFAKFGKNLKIWSAACSTGDEPYSLAMLLSKYMPLKNIKIIATDIDKQVLEKAKLGLYNSKSLKELPDEFVKKYFREIDDKTYQIDDEIKACVDFREHNLLRDPYPDQCNFIICRNVLIYFTEEAKDEVFVKFQKSLAKGGILFIGSTEQIINYKEIGLERKSSFYYEKA